MKVSKICNQNLVAVDRRGSVLDAARLMRDHHVGCVVITSSDGDGLRPVGIVTDRDIVVEILAEQIDPESVSLEDFMSRYPIVAREEDDVYDVLESMRTKGVRRVPVVNRFGFVVGLLAMDDVLGLVSKELTNIATLIDRAQETEQRLRATR